VLLAGPLLLPLPPLLLQWPQGRRTKGYMQQQIAIDNTSSMMLPPPHHHHHHTHTF
jgi:hypothetical protein